MSESTANLSLVFVGGQWLVGEIVLKDTDIIGGRQVRVLTKAMQMSVSTSPGPRPGEVNMQHVASPLLLMPSLDELELPADAVVKSVSELSPQDRRSVANGVALGNKMVNELRLAQSGLAIARDNGNGAVPRNPFRT
ncbi:MAG TPA: hypothetical protein VMI75_15605 [Polyangiaceae bacterium]|nr:hypothetical protein [Polyangiaceae bacterium]